MMDTWDVFRDDCTCDCGPEDTTQVGLRMRNYDMVELDPEVLRKKGNNAFHHDDYWRAISFYTKSLAWSPRGSKLRGLAYANRSAVLFALGLYEECIEDACTALENQYPPELSHKLYLRMGLSKKAMGMKVEGKRDIRRAMNLVKQHARDPEKEVAQAKELIEKKSSSLDDWKILRAQVEYFKPPKLSYGPHPDNPAISAALTMKNGRYFANRDLQIGDVLLVEDPLLYEVGCVDQAGETRWIYCSNCVKMCCNLKPCSSCSWMCYCSKKCEEEAWEKYHKSECVERETLMKRLIKKHDGHIPPTYRNVNYAFQLVAFFGLDNCVKAERGGRISDDAPEKMKQFFSIKRKFLRYIYCYHNCDVGLVADTYKLMGEEKRNFMRFIRGASIYLLNHMELVSDTTISFPDGVPSFDTQGVAYGVYPSATFIRQSCDPNVMPFHYRKTCVIRCVRAVRSGEEIFTTSKVDYRYNQMLMRRSYHSFINNVCECAACKGKWKLLCDQVFFHRVAECSHRSVRALLKLYVTKIERSWSKSKQISSLTPENLKICLRIHQLYRQNDRRDDVVYNKTLDFIVAYFQSEAKRFVTGSNELLPKPNHAIPIALLPVICEF